MVRFFGRTLYIDISFYRYFDIVNYSHKGDYVRWGILSGKDFIRGLPGGLCPEFSSSSLGVTKQHVSNRYKRCSHSNTTNFSDGLYKNDVFSRFFSRGECIGGQYNQRCTVIWPTNQPGDNQLGDHWRLGDTFWSTGRQSHNTGSRTETIPK